MAFLGGHQHRRRVRTDRSRSRPRPGRRVARVDGPRGRDPRRARGVAGGPPARRASPAPAAARCRSTCRASEAGGRLRNIYRRAFGAARSEILAAHSYFLPDRRFVRSITAAARRGVKVTLLLAGRSDIPLARAATARLYRRLVESGVEIREWTRSVHHAKVAVVDGAEGPDRQLQPRPVLPRQPRVAGGDRRPRDGRRGPAMVRGAGRAGATGAARGGAAAGLAGRLADAIGSAVARFTEWVARILSGR